MTYPNSQRSAHLLRFASLQIIISLITLGLKKRVVTLVASFVAFMQNPTCNTEIQKNLIRFADSELVLPTEPDV